MLNKIAVTISILLCIAISISISGTIVLSSDSLNAADFTAASFAGLAAVLWRNTRSKKQLNTQLS